MTYVLGQARDSRIDPIDDGGKITNGDRPVEELDFRINLPFLPPFTKPPIRPPLDDGINEVVEDDVIDTDLEDQYTNGEMPEDEHEPFVPPEEGYPDVGEQPVDEGMEYPDVGDEYSMVEEELPPAEEVPVVVEEEKKFPWLMVAGAGVGVIALIYILKKKK